MMDLIRDLYFIRAQSTDARVREMLAGLIERVRRGEVAP